VNTTAAKYLNKCGIYSQADLERLTGIRFQKTGRYNWVLLKISSPVEMEWWLKLLYFKVESIKIDYADNENRDNENPCHHYMVTRAQLRASITASLNHGDPWEFAFPGQTWKELMDNIFVSKRLLPLSKEELAVLPMEEI
jgi:hypothetical protein